MINNPLVEEINFEMTAIGLTGSKLLSANYDPSAFGNAEALFQHGPLLFRFIRDRGQDFLDIAPASVPDHFFQFEDIEIFMNWETLDEILSRKESEALNVVLSRIKENIRMLESAFSSDQAKITISLLEKIARERTNEALRKLKTNAEM